MTLDYSASLANLLWLLPAPPGPHAGYSGPSDSTLIASLADRFPELQTASTFAPGSLDLLVGVREGPLDGGAVTEAAGALATNGLALLIGLSRRRRGEIRRLRSVAEASRLADIRSYRFAESLQRPFSVIPGTRGALRAYQRSLGSPGVSGSLRELAIAAGWVPREFTGIVVTGRRA